MPIAANKAPGTSGPRVDWIVMRTPRALQSGPGANTFLYLYQIESASGAPALPIVKGGPTISYDDGSTCDTSTTSCRDPRGDLSRFTLTTGLGTSPFHLFTSFGVAAGDLDNTDTRTFIGTTVPTGGKVPATVPPLVSYGKALIDGHNCDVFANLGPAPIAGSACVDATAAGPSEGETGSDGVSAFLDVEGDEVGVATLEADITLLAWNFARKIQHGNPGTPEESIILWAMGPNPRYGAGAALDGDPFSPWSTGHPNGRPVPVAAPAPEPASLLLLGSGLLVAGVIARRFGTRK
jgi:hypothetical protein